jgi:hypothetical protein
VGRYRDDYLDYYEDYQTNINHVFSLSNYKKMIEEISKDFSIKLPYFPRKKLLLSSIAVFINWLRLNPETEAVVDNNVKAYESKTKPINLPLISRWYRRIVPDKIPRPHEFDAPKTRKPSPSELKSAVEAQFLSISIIFTSRNRFNKKHYSYQDRYEDTR